MKNSFNVWSVSREDIAYALDISEEEADKLTDEQMEKIADRMGHYLQYDMDSYWNAARDACDDVLNRTFIHVKE